MSWNLPPSRELNTFNQHQDLVEDRQRLLTEWFYKGGPAWRLAQMLFTTKLLATLNSSARTTA